MNVLIDDQTEPDRRRPACADRAQRRQWVRDNPRWFGIDYIEVEPHIDGDFWKLRVGLLDADLPGQLVAANFRIESAGESRRPTIRVQSVELCDPCDPTVPAAAMLTLRPQDSDPSDACPGDFGTYFLRLVEVQPDRPDEPSLQRKHDVDPVFDRANFRFTPPDDCDDGVEVDCALRTPTRVRSTGGSTAIDYTARDYEGLRELLMRRLQLTTPYWTERHASDLFVTLVELLAYAGDRLSYAQDAVATEAYLATARRRISVRRLVGLIGYKISEGCAARSWLCLDLEPGDKWVKIEVDDVVFLTASRINRSYQIVDGGPLAFIPLAPTWGQREEGADAYLFHPSLNTLYFYSWGDEVCQLEKGATSATLWHGPGQFPTYKPDPHKTQRTRIDSGPSPSPGDVIVFMEVIGPRTGAPADADPAHRHAVRLEDVQQVYDPVIEQTVWQVSWNVADALPMPLTISCLIPKQIKNQTDTTRANKMTRQSWECERCSDVTVAKCNVMLVEHGEWRLQKQHVQVPANLMRPPECQSSGSAGDPLEIAAAFCPVIADGPITHAEPFPRMDDVALRQAHLLRKFRSRLDGVLVRANSFLTTRKRPLTEHDSIGRLLRGLYSEVDRGLAKLNLRPPSARATPEDLAKRCAEQRRAVGKLRMISRVRRNEVLRWIDALIRRLERGRPLIQEDLEQFQNEFGLTRDHLEEEGLIWNSARWLGPAAEALTSDPSRSVPNIVLQDAQRTNEFWLPQYDLLASGPTDRNFVAEIDESGRAHLRFPLPVDSAASIADDDTLGQCVNPGQEFIVRYRTGSGAIGNIPAEALTTFKLIERDRTSAPPRMAAIHDSQPVESQFAAITPTTITGIFQPLPAKGGVDPETLEHVRRLAPGAIQGRLDRAITPDDYATLARRHPGVANAAATAQFDGVGTRIVLAIDAAGQAEASAELLSQIRGRIDAFRRINHDIAVVPAIYVALGLTLSFRVETSAQAGHVREALLKVFSSEQGGYFHPDLWTFGRSVEVGAILAQARSVAGIRDVSVTQLTRLDPDGGATRDDRVQRDGMLRIDPTEIARLENKPSRSEGGKLRLILIDGTDDTCSSSTSGSTKS
ncbi:baseplate J/gp47 family protein [Schlesneria paludicola]|uniref:baseplate J/gp47 family protein n=1 Tax=Schlesneria paludicola TaxID=360056 RepID=UPI00029A6A70|nr:baseplate J/gp47 family protein [Schlesneria paludicola]